MEGKRITVEELKRALATDFERLAERVVEAMNGAKDGHVIADTEELVRAAAAVFREQMYARAIGLLQNKQEAFSPRPGGSSKGVPRRPPWAGPRKAATGRTRNSSWCRFMTRTNRMVTWWGPRATARRPGA